MSSPTSKDRMVALSSTGLPLYEGDVVKAIVRIPVIDDVRISAPIKDKPSGINWHHQTHIGRIMYISRFCEFRVVSPVAMLSFREIESIEKYHVPSPSR